MEEEIERLEAVSDAGQRYTIHIMQDFIDASTLSARKRIPGMMRAVLSDGSHVNRIDDETFEIVSTGEILRRTSD